MKARRDEAEQDYLARHQEAVASTQRYLDDANAQLADAIRRAADKRLEADALEMTIEVDGRKRREASETEAAKLVADARERAAAIVSEAEERSARPRPRRGGAPRRAARGARRHRPVLRVAAVGPRVERSASTSSPDHRGRTVRIRNAFRAGLAGGLGVLVALAIGGMVTHLATILTYVGAAVFLALGLDPMVTPAAAAEDAALAGDDRRARHRDRDLRADPAPRRAGDRQPDGEPHRRHRATTRTASATRRS